ncbi:GntR family transcriptional regulator [Xylanimonas allomyrinae]|uniref:GntR family transcriptional regulator n=1 Tax=Xylanimonas allomyrinae TaxID=2509459 RepID=A0A4P6EKT3_9MICO|nr:GntR family transcriptional regulator [Xylanimonas allomyrinae]QAY62766.1 GntR family transcriptional regulator [Xylanimonas allomyrinae]
MDTAARSTLSKSERVYQTLRGRIADGTYVGGFRLVLDKLARELDVSPVPVREAVRRLEAEGLVTFTRNVGAEVRGIDVHEYVDAMQTLAYLEGAATSLASPHLTREHRLRARELNREMLQLLAHGFDPVRFTELNEQFHRTLCAACPNAHLMSVLEREWQRMSLIRRSSFAAIPARTQESVCEHTRILDLIEADAPANEVESAVRDHKLRTMAQYLATRRGVAAS